MRRLAPALAALLLVVSCSVSTSSSFEGDALPVKVETPPPPDTGCTDACALSGLVCAPFDTDGCFAACDAPDAGPSKALEACLGDAGMSCSSARACLRPPANPPFAAGQYGTKVKDVAGPFTLTTPTGDWDFATEWTGQDSYLFLGYAPGASGGGIDTNKGLFAGSIRPLLAASPRNVHYVFGWLRDQAGFESTRARWQQEIDTLPEPDRTWWREHVHFSVPVLTGTAGWVGQMLTARWTNPPRYLGNELTSFAIDRFQRIREVGMLGRLTQNGVAPDLSLLRHEAEAFNLEAETAARLLLTALVRDRSAVVARTA